MVRLGRYEADFRKDERAARWRSVRLPVPEMLEIGPAGDGFYAISRRAHGLFLEGLDAGAVTDARASVLGLLDAMRAADLRDTSGFGWWGAQGVGSHASWRAYLLDVARDQPGGRTSGWRARMASSPTGVEPFDRAYERLRELADALPDERHLIHSDLLHGNVLVDDGQVTAIFDWGNALYGDWLYDVAWIAFFSPWHPGLRALEVVREARARGGAGGLDLAGFEERLLACSLHIGLDGQVYSASIESSGELKETARRTLEFAADRA